MTGRHCGIWPFYLLPQWIVHNAQSLVRLATISADSTLDIKQPLKVNSQCATKPDVPTLAVCLTKRILSSLSGLFVGFFPPPQYILIKHFLGRLTAISSTTLYYGSLDARHSVYRSRVLVEIPLAQGLPFSHASYLTEVSWETSGTQTLESIDFILAVTPIHARVTCTFIDVFLTVISCIARWTDTPITINQVLERNEKV